jgi:hypothetical protein
MGPLVGGKLLNNVVDSKIQRSKRRKSSIRGYQGRSRHKSFDNHHSLLSIQMYNPLRRRDSPGLGGGSYQRANECASTSDGSSEAEERTKECQQSDIHQFLPSPRRGRANSETEARRNSPSLNPFLNLLGMSLRYRVRPVPVVFRRLPLTDQLTKHERSDEKGPGCGRRRRR